MTDKKSEVRRTRRWRKSFKTKCKSARFKPVDYSDTQTTVNETERKSQTLNTQSSSSSLCNVLFEGQLVIKDYTKISDRSKWVNICMHIHLYTNRCFDGHLQVPLNLKGHSFLCKVIYIYLFFTFYFFY